MTPTRPLVALALLGVMAVVKGVEGRDAEYYLNRWSAENKNLNKVITPANPSGQIPSPLQSPWSRLPPGATARAVLAVTTASNATITTQTPADAQLLPPSVYDPPATLPAFPDSTQRDPKLFKLSVSPMLSLFSRRVSNIPCVSSSGENGTCYSASVCNRLGGATSGQCKTGGSCCVFLLTCGGVVTQNCTYFVNQNYPAPFDGVSSCQLTVNKINSNICQLRLDFDSLVLAGPETTDHQCLNDRFTVSGGSRTPTICGTSTGNHMYVDLGRTTNTQAVLTAVTMGPSFERTWKIKISQIPCDANYAAPTSCLQYYQGVTGQIKTYNYDVSTGLQLSNQDYTSCVRTEMNFCGIQYMACQDTVNVNNPQSFSLTGSTATPVGGVVGSTNCGKDWLIIPCISDSSVDPPSNCVDRICGDAFNIRAGTTVGDTVLYSNVKPFMLVYRTDNTEGSATTPETNNRGYCLNYVQQPCV